MLYQHKQIHRHLKGKTKNANIHWKRITIFSSSPTFFVFFFDYNKKKRRNLISYRTTLETQVQKSIFVRKTTDYPGLTFISAHLFILRLLTCVDFFPELRGKWQDLCASDMSACLTHTWSGTLIKTYLEVHVCCLVWYSGISIKDI